MGLFSKKPNWESLPAEDVAEMCRKDPKLYQDLKKGRIPGISGKERQKIEKIYKRAYEGEKGLSALAAALKGGGTGNKNYQNIPLKERVHPAEYRRILEREAKRQGLL